VQWEGSATGVTIVIHKHEQRHRKCGSPSLQNKNVIEYAVDILTSSTESNPLPLYKVLLSGARWYSNQQQWAPVAKDER
jgi:hypothetical protein